MEVDFGAIPGNGFHTSARPSVASRWDRRFKEYILTDKLGLIIVLNLRILRQVLARASLGDHSHRRKRLKTLFGERGTVVMRLFA